MKKLGFIFFTLFACLAARQTEAILPPLYQTSSEIEAIMVNEQLGQKLQSGEVILKVEKNDRGYRLTTNHHQLQIDIEYEPTQRPGPVHFELRFGEPTPLSSQ